MRAWFAAFLTTADGKSDTLLTMSVLGVLSYIGFGGYAYIIRGQPFDAFQYSAGFGSMMAASAAGLGIRTKLMATPNSVGTDNVDTH